ncbi:unnamed protein product [Periconia digitata]|uniref:Chitin synthase n=1 Tax=Periconia digitata TaxID=1303443 RepID=A0A9W4U3H8_9PLEO|nr:unnamed protein product [Periconia digitata]
MSGYNRLGHDREDQHYSPAMNPLRTNRSPSPGQPLQNYQLEDHYVPQPSGALEIPMGPGPLASSDRLQLQPSYSVENIPYGPGDYHDDYRPHPHHTASDYSLDPQAHHDAYYTQPYDPSPLDDGSRPYAAQQDPYYQDDEVGEPILHTQTSYGPDPHQDPENPFQDDEPLPAPSPAPTAPIKRWKTVKKVALFRGNYVLDCPIPPRLLNQVNHAQPPERDEFTHMRYSAVTCDPKHFVEERFTLRQKLFAKNRETELFIVITMYNEEDELFARTLSGVIKNIEHMNNRPNSKTWGKEAWKKIVVCVVSDGRNKINPRTRAVLAGLGVYQDGVAKETVNGKDVTAHLYEYTTQMTVDIKKNVVNVRKGNTPVQMLFCLKEKNQKKINSHRWFFQAFGDDLDPNICVLIDAGTKPGKDSIYQLWKAFDLEPMCAGACGEIKAMLVHGKKLLNPLVATQNFEYKMSNILDKPLESAFGFITVLPGAFSAYRYCALQNDKTGQGPLQKYFLGEEMHGTNAGIFTANMYLAEDRILCFELVSKRQSRWILQYVKSATGETDVPTEMADFILQRRRWLNGSFFAAVYALAHSFDIFRSGHTFLRKMMFLVEFFYQTISMLFAWLALGNFFLVFRILTASLATELGTVGNVLFIIFEWLYVAVLISCFVLSLGNRPNGSNRLYMTMVYFWCVIMAYLMFASIFITVRSVQSQIAKNNGFSVGDIFTDQIFFTLIVSLASTYAMWLVVSIIFLDPWHMFTSFIQYLLLTPTYINILNVYAFCNTHDISWGTKGDTKAEKLPSVATGADGKAEIEAPTNDADLNTQYEAELATFRTKWVEEKKEDSAQDKQEDYYKGFRSSVVLFWMFCNLALVVVVLQSGGLEVTVKTPEDQAARQDRVATIYLAVVLWSVAGLSAFRFIGAMWFLVIRMFRGV